MAQQIYVHASRLKELTILTHNIYQHSRRPIDSCIVKSQNNIYPPILQSDHQINRGLSIATFDYRRVVGLPCSPWLQHETHLIYWKSSSQWWAPLPTLGMHLPGQWDDIQLLRFIMKTRVLHWFSEATMSFKLAHFTQSQLYHVLFASSMVIKSVIIFSI